jgi:hypothetical protein
MSDNQLKNFVGQIIGLNANPPGTGASYGGMLGSASPRGHAMDDLKRKALEFASEHTKKTQNKEKLETLKNEIEGHLLGLNSLQVIDDKLLNQLRDDLHNLS